MRIVIDNSGYELENVGDLAMLQVAVRRFRAAWPTAEIFVLTTAPQQLQGCCPGSIPLDPGGRSLWLREQNLFGRLHRHIPGMLARRLVQAEHAARRRWPLQLREYILHRMQRDGFDTRAMAQYLDAVLTADLVVGTGGGYFTDDFDTHALNLLETLGLGLAGGAPAALLGQGLGPATRPPLLNAMRAVFPRLKLIALRERRAGMPLLRSLHVDPARIAVTGDDGIEAVFDVSAASPPAQPANGIGVNLRTAFYAGVPEGAVAVVRQSLADAAVRRGAPLVPLPVSYQGGGEGEDVRSIDRLVRELPGVQVAPQPARSVADLVRAVAGCRIVVTGSYHAGVFALAQGIPVVALVKSPYYVDKFAGLAEEFGGAANGCELLMLDDAELPAKLAAAMDRAWDSSDQLAPALRAAADRQVRESRAAYDRLATIVNQRIEHRAAGHGRRRHGRAPERVGAHAGL